MLKGSASATPGSIGIPYTLNFDIIDIIAFFNGLWKFSINRIYNESNVKEVEDIKVMLRVLLIQESRNSCNTNTNTST